MTFLYRIFMLGIPVVELRGGGNRNASNSLVHIAIKKDIPHRAAILLQEKVECAFKRMIFALALALAGVVAWLTGQPLFMLLAVPGVLLSRIPAIHRTLEYRGQGVETYIKSQTGMTLEEAEAGNAYQLKHGYDQFEGMSVEQVQAGLRRWRGWSKRMAEAFRGEWA